MNWLQKASAGYYSIDKYYNGYWVDPSGKTYELGDTHDAWISHNRELLADTYGINIQDWEIQFIEEEESESYQSLREELIRDRSFEQDIDESQVVLLDEDEEKLMNSAQEGSSGPGGVESVDYLIEQGLDKGCSEKCYYSHGDFSRR